MPHISERERGEAGLYENHPAQNYIETDKSASNVHRTKLNQMISLVFVN